MIIIIILTLSLFFFFFYTQLITNTIFACSVVLRCRGAHVKKSIAKNRYTLTLSCYLYLLNLSHRFIFTCFCLRLRFFPRSLINLSLNFDDVLPQNPTHRSSSMNYLFKKMFFLFNQNLYTKELNVNYIINIIFCRG